MLTSLPYPQPYLLVQVLHEGGGMGTLLIGVWYKCREMVLGGHLAWYHWREWSINRGEMRRKLSFGNTPSLWFPTPNSLPSLLQPAKAKQPATISFPPFLHSLTLSPSHSLTNLSLPSFILKSFLYLFYLLQRPNRTWKSGDLTSP